LEVIRPPSDRQLLTESQGTKIWSTGLHLIFIWYNREKKDEIDTVRSKHNGSGERRFPDGRLENLR
jgi:hypothetical protein